MMNNIYEIRGERVMLDEDLAKIYGVETKVFNQSVKRNLDRFPKEFMFQLDDEEFQILKSQIVTSSDICHGNFGINKPNVLRSQIVTSNRGGRKYRPYAFTEHGAVMLASVLRSKRAIQMSIEVVNSFVQFRRAISSREDILRQLAEVRSYVLKRGNEADREFKKVWNAIEKLSPADENTRNKIGF